MRIVMNGTGLKFLRTLGFQLGLAEAPPSPALLPPALKPKVMAAAAPGNNGFAFPELQTTLPLSEPGLAIQEDMRFPAASLLTAPPPEETGSAGSNRRSFGESAPHDGEAHPGAPPGA